MTSGEPQQQEPPQPQSSASELRLRGSALLLTNVTKIVGLTIAVNEVLIRHNARDSVIALCALFVLGAQVVEDVVLRAIDRLFSRE